MSTMNSSIKTKYGIFTTKVLIFNLLWILKVEKKLVTIYNKSILYEYGLNTSSYNVL
jgi:hypothetical protein